MHMSSIQCVIILMYLLDSSISQNNPICKAKRYQCSKEPLDADVCVKVIDEQEKYYYVKSCTGDKSYCPVDNAVFGTPAKCEKPQTTSKQVLLPYDECNKDEDCLSLLCNNRRCTGKLQAETCKTHDDCDVGLFCESLSGQCVTQKEFDEACTSDLECVNNCICNKNKCAFYYTFAIGSDADNPKACESGYIENGQCVAGLKTKNPGQPCTSDADCEFIDSNGVVKKTGTCSCGFNAGIYTVK